MDETVIVGVDMIIYSSLQYMGVIKECNVFGQE